MTDLHKILHDDAEHVSRVSSVPAIKNFIVKIQDGRQPLERPLLHHHRILQFLDFQDGGRLPSRNFENEIFLQPCT